MYIRVWFFKENQMNSNICLLAISYETDIPIDVYSNHGLKKKKEIKRIV